MSTDTDTISSLQPEKATLTTKLAECNAKLLKESPVAPVVAAPVVADAVGGRRRRKRGKSSKRRASKRKKGRGKSSRRKRR